MRVPDPIRSARPSRSKKRRVRLPKPRLQLKLVCGFIGLSALAMVAQAMLLASLLVRFSHDLPVSGDILADATPDLVVAALIYSFAIVLPASIFVGVQLTFRTAGPIYRFERYFEAMAAGDDPGPLKLRTGDELTELCDLINAGLAENRRQAAQPEHDRAA